MGAKYRSGSRTKSAGRMLLWTIEIRKPDPVLYSRSWTYWISVSWGFRLCRWHCFHLS